MWNLLYRDDVFRWYSYPFFHAVAACFFLVASVALYPSCCLRDGPTAGKNGATPLPLARVLDLSLLFFLIYYVASKAGSLAYTRPDNPFVSFIDISGKGLASHVGVFFLALLSLARVARLPSLDRLWQVWAGPFVVAVGIGYLACYAQGCCFGSPLRGEPWYGVRFPLRLSSEDEILGAPALEHQMRQGLIPLTSVKSLPVHAVQLYHMALLIPGGAALAWGVRRVRWSGWFLLGATYLMLVRVVLEGFRGDHVPGYSLYSAAPTVRIVMLVILALLLTGKVALDCRNRLSHD